MPDVNPSLNTRFRMFPLLPQLLCSAGRFCDAVFISGGQTPPLSTPLLGAWALPRGSLTPCFLSALLQFRVSRLVSNPPELVFVCSVTRGPPWPLRQLTCGCPVPQHRLLKRPSFPSERPRPLPEVVRPGARGFISGAPCPFPGLHRPVTALAGTVQTTVASSSAVKSESVGPPPSLCSVRLFWGFLEAPCKV